MHAYELTNNRIYECVNHRFFKVTHRVLLLKVGMVSQKIHQPVNSTIDIATSGLQGYDGMGKSGEQGDSS